MPLWDANACQSLGPWGDGMNDRLLQEHIRIQGENKLQGGPRNTISTVTGAIRAFKFGQQAFFRDVTRLPVKQYVYRDNFPPSPFHSGRQGGMNASARLA